MSSTVIVGTRGSALALTQTNLVISALQVQHPNLHCTSHIIQTQGDVDQSSSLRVLGGQGAFVQTIEAALLRSEIDLAVHSLKDLPATLTPGVAIYPVLTREDPRDALVSRLGVTLADLPVGARVGTGSARRAAHLRALRPKLVISDIRGNVDTRLRKLDSGDYDAIVLAAAGLRRLGLEDRITEVFSPAQMIPAPSQGILGVQTRADDTALANYIRVLVDPATATASRAERAFLARLGAGCRLPVAAYATVDATQVTLQVMLASEDGAIMECAEASAPLAEAERLGADLAEELLARAGFNAL